MGAVVQLKRPRTVEEAWQRYAELVDQRARDNLWKDLDHNKRLAQAWEEWARRYLAEGETR